MSIQPLYLRLHIWTFNLEHPLAKEEQIPLSSKQKHTMHASWTNFNKHNTKYKNFSISTLMLATFLSTLNGPLKVGLIQYHATDTAGAPPPQCQDRNLFFFFFYQLSYTGSMLKHSTSKWAKLSTKVQTDQLIYAPLIKESNKHLC